MTLLKDLYDNTLFENMAKKDPKAVLKLVEQAEKKMLKVRQAMDEVVKLTSTIPGEFKSKIHAGNIHNLEHPKEYAIWVAIENIKGLYTLSRDYRETMDGIGYLKEKLKAYK
jgi:hypothetical protein